MASHISRKTLSLVVPEALIPAAPLEALSGGKDASDNNRTVDVSGTTELRALIAVSDVAGAAWIGNDLNSAGYVVQADFAQSPYEFAVRVGAVSYDVIISEYALTGWTAMDLLATVHDKAIEVPVIIVNETPADDLAVECIQAGASDFLTGKNSVRLPMAVGRATAERRSSQERGEQAELIKKLRMAVGQSPASVIFTDLEGRIQYVNSRFSELSGYTSAEALGKNPRLLRSGCNPSTLYADLWKTIGAGNVWHGEMQNRRKNGELYWVSASIAPIRDENGVVTHFLGTQEDVTERRQDEQRVRESEERFRQLAGNIQEVFCVATISLSEMLYISPGYEQIWGRSCQSLYEDPQSFIDAFVPDDRKKLFAFIVEIQKGITPEPATYRLQKPDGSIRWVLVNGAPIRDANGLIYRVSGSALDVTDRQVAVEALRESETRFRLLAEASFDGVVIVVDGLIRESNSGLAGMFGYTVEECIGRSMLDLVDEGSRALVQSRMTEDVVAIYEFVGKHKNGRKLVLEAAARRYQVDGRPARLIAVRDITEKRNLENQFRQAQKMEAVGRLAGGVAHDFNNLLTVIMSYTEMMTRDLPANDPHLDDLNEIQKASKSAATLTKQLLAFSRQEVIEPKVVLLNEAVGNAKKMLGRVIGEDIELVTNLGADACPIVIDAGQLEQIIMNLAVNARDSMPRGGKLTLETAIVDLDDDYANKHWPAVAGRFAMLAVRDSGIGMSPETQARIFEPFFTTKETGKGTGLGLATVYGIVKQSQGFIWVYSEPGKGTAFKIYFPLAVDAKQSNEVRPEPVTLNGTETVLIVEDSPAVRAAARLILQRYGYKVLEAPTGKAALAFASRKRHRIDLLLTDVVMPEMSGREVAEHFATLRPDTKVIFMSGYTDDAVVRHGILQAGIAYLQKPFTGHTLATRVREVLDMSCYPE